MNKITLIEIIAQSDFDKVFKILKNLDLSSERSDELSHLNAQFSEYNKKDRKGILSNEQKNIQYNTLTDSMIKFVNSIDFESDKQNIAINKSRLITIDKSISRLIINLKEFDKTISTHVPKYSWIEKFQTELSSINTKWDNKSFSVAVVALIKSGKSTLINSWIGGEYLPSATLAETMKIVRIRHNNRIEIGKLYSDGKIIAEGIENIRLALRDLNKNSRDLTDNVKSEILLEVKIEGLKDYDIDNYSFDILDTPGVNESGVASLNAKIDRLLNSADVIVYLLDYTKLKMQDEGEMLQKLKTLREGLIQEISRRMFFVVNKIDMANRHDEEQKLGKSQVKDYVIEKIIEQNIKNIKLRPDDIFLISSEEALLSRLIKGKHYTDSQMRDFKKRAFGAFKSEKEHLISEIEEAADYFIEKSGITALEEGILNNIFINRSDILYRSILDDALRILNYVENNLEIGKKSLQVNKNLIAGLKKRIQNTQQKVETLDTKAGEFKQVSKALIEEKIKEFQKKTHENIVVIFSEDEDAVSANMLPKSIADFLKRTKLEIETTDKKVAIAKVKLLNQKIYEYFGEQFTYMWQDVMNSIYDNFNLYTKAIYKEINPLLRRIEEVIESELEIRLNPVSIMPIGVDISEFYNAVQENVDYFIKSNNNLHPRFTKWKNIEIEAQHLLGVKLWERFSFKVPIDFEIYETSYSVLSSKYQEYIKDVLTPMINNMMNNAEDAVEKQFIKSITLAKKELSDYSDNYIASMEIEINNIQSESEKQGRSNLILKDLKNTKLLLNLIEEIKSSIF